ncbi:histidine phosphatase family protein [Aurantimonas sp. Leaf443]|uniref:histidine phosphatase family protein n=1 Tax=Aurantimonas sp. Leaf443 TaxID=1736378 RepID=UPI0006FA09D3|nr:histidine phosphatase family protein [Aurantimonas sp. Leaf443]KQT88060.1 phosphoglycerate mutase [Aurantimonas sp. Leaf443]
MLSPGLLLCRHGETDWNAEGRIQGQRDVPLNDRGRAQARRNGTVLRDLLGERAGAYRYLASPLGRTRETMEIIRREIGLDPAGYETDTRLVELHFGAWQGYTLAEIRDRHPEQIRARKADKWNYVPPGAEAESYATLETRIAPVFEALEGPVLVVAHGGVVRTVLHRFAGHPSLEAAHMGVPQDRFLSFSEGNPRWL